jgi:hypothetical protein
MQELLAGQQQWTPSRVKAFFLLLAILFWHGCVVVIPCLWDRKADPKASFPWPNFIVNTPSFIASSVMLLLYVVTKGSFRRKFLHCAKRVFTNASTGSVAQA